MAWRDRTRAGYYAWATLAIVLTLRLNSPQLGLVAGRQLHLLPVLVAPALAGFICRHAPGGWLGRVTLVALVALFVAVLPRLAISSRANWLSGLLSAMAWRIH